MLSVDGIGRDGLRDEPVLRGIGDVRLLEDIVFSQRCYITRWAYLLELEDSGWIIGAIDRLGEFVDVIKG